MHNVDSAADLLPQGQRAVVIMARGDLFEMNDDGTGSTGNWKFDPERHLHLDKVVIYYRHGDGRANDVYAADYDGEFDSESDVRYPSPGRYVIRVTGMQKAGTTRRDRKEFAASGTNPIRFLPDVRRHGLNRRRVDEQSDEYRNTEMTSEKAIRELAELERQIIELKKQIGL